MESILNLGNAFLSAMLLASADAVVLLNPQGRIETVNPAAEAIFGYKAEQLVGRNMAGTLIAPDCVAEFKKQALARSIRQSTTHRQEMVLLRADGSEFYAEVHTAVFQSNEDMGWVFIIRDISRFKKMEQNLLESEQRFRMLADATPMLIWMSDTQAGLNFFNKSWLQFTGKTLEDSFGNAWIESMHPDDRVCCAEIYRNAFQSRKPFEREYRLRHRDGLYHWFIEKGAPRFSAEGEFLGFIGSCADVTQLKESRQLMENEVISRTRELQEKSRLLHSIIENVPAMIFMKDAQELRFQLINKKAEEILGFPQEALLGKNDYDFFPKEQADFFTRKDRETLANKSLVDIPAEPLKSGTGETIILHTKKVPILDEAGNPLFLLGISEDITEAQQARERIEQLNQQLEAQIQRNTQL